MKVLIIGASGALGRTIAESLARADETGAARPQLRLAGRNLDACTALAQTLGSESASLDTGNPATWAEALEGIGLVIDASRFAGRDHALVRAALDSGSHWLDTSASRAWVVDMAKLDEEAVKHGRVALAGAGFFCAGLDAIVRAAAQSMVRINEVLVGIAPGQRGRYGPATGDEWLGAPSGTVRMLAGKEWSEREFFGDRRFFEHPPPVGAQRSFNVDCADLELYAGRPIKATNVRVSLSLQGGLRNRVAAWLFRGAKRPNAMGTARRLAPLGGSSPSAAVTVIVRGLDDRSLPTETRLSLSLQGAGVPVETAAVLVLARRIAAGEELKPGAGPCVGRVSSEELLAELAGSKVSVHRGNMGGWQS